MVYSEFLSELYSKDLSVLNGYPKEFFLACHDYYIYLLISNNEIVYIGQSTLHPTSRISNHIRSKKIFDSIVPLHIVGCKSKEDLTDIEGYLIMKHKPKYNISLPSCSWLLRPKQLRKIALKCNISLQDFTSFRKKLGAEKYIVEFKGLKMFDCKLFIDDLKNNNLCH